jgi:hypothetical protein
MGIVRYRTVIGRSRELRGPDALELGFAGMIVAVAMMVAVWFGIQLVRMTQTLDAVTLARGAQINAFLYRAAHGRWPPAGARDIVVGAGKGNYVEHLVLGEGGVVTAELTLGPAPGGQAGRGVRSPGRIHGFVSFRPELLGSQDAPAISFLCGYAAPVAGAVGTTAAGHTTLARADLPPSCR